MIDTAIVLSYKNNDDGLPGEEQIRRLDAGIDLYVNDKAATLTMTGHHDRDDWHVDKTLAESMRDYVIDNGIPKEDVLMEDVSLDTYAQATFTKWGIVDPRGWESLGVVTSDWHVDRTKAYFDHVYGPGYNISYFGVPNTRAERDNPRTAREIQQQEVEKFEKNWGHISPGDDTSIRDKLFTDHPFYNGNYPFDRKGKSLPDFSDWLPSA